MNMAQVFSMVVKEQGVGGLFKVHDIRPVHTNMPPHSSARLISTQADVRVLRLDDGNACRGSCRGLGWESGRRCSW